MLIHQFHKTGLGMRPLFSTGHTTSNLITTPPPHSPPHPLPTHLFIPSPLTSSSPPHSPPHPLPTHFLIPSPLTSLPTHLPPHSPPSPLTSLPTHPPPTLGSLKPLEAWGHFSRVRSSTGHSRRDFHRA